MGEKANPAESVLACMQTINDNIQYRLAGPGTDLAREEELS